MKRSSYSTEGLWQKAVKMFSSRIMYVHCKSQLTNTPRDTKVFSIVFAFCSSGYQNAEFIFPLSSLYTVFHTDNSTPLIPESQHHRDLCPCSITDSKTKQSKWPSYVVLVFFACRDAFLLLLLDAGTHTAYCMASQNREKGEKKKKEKGKKWEGVLWCWDSFSPLPALFGSNLEGRKHAILGDGSLPNYRVSLCP